MAIWPFAHHILATCINQVKLWTLACPLWRCGRNLLFSINYRCQTTKISNRLLYTDWVKHEDLSSLNTSFSSARIKISMRHLTRQEFRYAVMQPEIKRREVRIFKWWTTCLASAPIWMFSTDSTLISILKRRMWIVWSAEQHTSCSWKMKSWWKWLWADIRCSSAEYANCVYVRTLDCKSHRYPD